MNRSLLFAALLVCAALTACGGGGGGSGPAPLPVVTPTPVISPAPIATLTAPPTGGGGFVPASGPITALSAVSGNFGSTMLATSTSANFIVQSGSQPAKPSNPAALGTFTVTASESTGLATSALTRSGAAQARALATLAEAHRAAAVDGFREIPPATFGIERIVASLPRISGDVRAPQSVRQLKANVGDQRQFTVLYSGIGGASTQCPNPVQNFTCYVNVTATLKAVSQRAYVWVDNVSLGNPNEFPDQSVFATTAANFDSYFAIETQAFGPGYSPANVSNFAQCDTNGNQLPQNQYQPIPDMTGVDPHISVLITDALVGTGEGGYFFGGDLIAQNILNCSPPLRYPSNGLPMIVIGSDNYPTGPNLPQYNPGYWLGTDMPRSLSHELQHYLHNLNKYYGKLATNQPFIVDEAWIDEGSSMLAEDLAANGVAIDTPRYSYSYMVEPSEFSLTSFIGYQPNPLSTSSPSPYGFYAYTAGNYGAAYLFMRYIYDRFGGAAALHAVYSDFRPGNGFQSNVNPILAAAGNAESWSQLYGEWAIAVSAQSSGITSDPRYSFAAGIILRGPVQVPSRRGPPQQIRYLVFGGPQPPESFDASGNLIGYVTLSAGSAPSVRALDGAANFFWPAPVGGGATVRTQTGSLNAPQGALVQGQMPTPQPTSF